MAPIIDVFVSHSPVLNRLSQNISRELFLHTNRSIRLGVSFPLYAINYCQLLSTCHSSQLQPAPPSAFRATTSSINTRQKSQLLQESFTSKFQLLSTASFSTSFFLPSFPSALNKFFTTRHLLALYVCVTLLQFSFRFSYSHSRSHSFSSTSPVLHILYLAELSL